MKLRLLADVHISPITVAELQASGYEIHRVTEVLPAYASDAEIIERARHEESVIVTQDLDFSALIAQSGLNHLAESRRCKAPGELKDSEDSLTTD